MLRRDDIGNDGRNRGTVEVDGEPAECSCGANCNQGGREAERDEAGGRARHPQDDRGASTDRVGERSTERL